MSSSPPSNPPPSEPIKSESDSALLLLIDDAISWNEKRFSQKGINHWVLIAALSSLIWLLFQEINKGVIDWDSVICFTLLLYFIYRIYSSVKLIATDHLKQFYKSDVLTFDPAAKLLAEQIDHNISQALLATALLFLCYHSYALFKLEFIYFSIYIANIVLDFAVSALPELFIARKEHPIKQQTIFSIIFIAIHLLIILHVLVIFLNHNMLIMQIQYSMLIMGAIICLENLSHISINSLESVQIQTLRVLKQEILLNNKSDADHRRRYEVISKGHSIAEYIASVSYKLQQDANKWGISYTKYNEYLIAAMKDENNYDAAKSNDLYKATKKACRKFRISICKAFLNHGIIFIFIKYYSTQSESYINQVVQPLEAIMNSLVVYLRESKQNMNSIMERKRVLDNKHTQQ